MKLNYDCVRALLLTLENHLEYSDDNMMKPIIFQELCTFPEMKEFTEHDILNASEQLHAGGYIVFNEIYASGRLFKASYEKITFNGIQFLEVLRSETNWKEAKEIAKKKGSVGLVILETTLRGISEGLGNAYFKNQ